MQSAGDVNSTTVLLDEDITTRDAYYGVSWMLTVLTVLVIAICIAMRNKIRQAIGIFQETSVGAGNIDVDIGVDLLKRVSQLYATAHAPSAIPFFVPILNRLLIGACNPMLRPIHVS